MANNGLRRLLSAASAAGAAAAGLRSMCTCTLEAAAVVLPHPRKARTGGEDAYFIGDSVYGVFDGVGGWALKGIDSGEFSRDLAKRTAEHCAAGAGTLEGALTLGLREVSAQGSCTACLVRIDRTDGVLSALNVGDSGFRLFRPKAASRSPPRDPRALRVEAASRSQQHYFNCPLQLGGDGRDRPSHGDAYSLSVLPGDYVVLATDGLLDNLHDEEIAKLLGAPGEPAGASDTAADEAQAPPSAAELAQLVATRARLVSLDQKRRTPFAESAASEGLSMLGGKVDDITVLVVKVLPGEEDGSRSVDLDSGACVGASARGDEGPQIRSRL
jgi:protein phosphatase PTC7